MRESPRLNHRALRYFQQGNSAIIAGEGHEQPVPVYGIGLLSESDPQRQDAARLALGERTDASGGLALYLKNVAKVESIVRQVAKEAGKR